MDIFSSYRTIPIINACGFEEIDIKLSVLSKIDHNIAEIVLRRENSIEILKYARSKYKDFIIGAGTVYDVKTLDLVLETGVNFIMSPGFSESLIDYASKNNIKNFIPGAATPSEIIKIIEYDYKLIKIFPISYLGGIKYIKTLDSIFAKSKIKFIPSGGVNASNVKEYLKLENVEACSSSSFADEFIH